MKELRKLIEIKLKAIDASNIANKGSKVVMASYELSGIKMALLALGIYLELNINPYCYENNKPSTYTLTIEE